MLNSSTDIAGYEEVPEQWLLLYTFLVSANLIFSIPSNIVVLFVLQKQQLIEETTRSIYQVFFCFNLSMGVSWCIWHLIWFSTDDTTVCWVANRVLAYPIHVLLYAVMINMCFISVEKYVFISRPLRYHVIFQTLRVRVFLISSFLMPCVLCVPYLYSVDLLTYLQSGCMGTVFFFESHAAVKEVTEVLAQGFIGCASLTSLIVNVLIIRIAYIQSHRVDLARRLRLRRGQETEEGIGSGNVPPRIGRRRNRGIASVVFLAASFYLVWILWLIYRALPPHLKVFSETFGANCGWLQPVSYIVATREARNILRRRNAIR